MWAQRQQFRLEAMPKSFSQRYYLGQLKSISGLLKLYLVDGYCIVVGQVERESNGDDAKTVKPIEIPPPRPKRKPMHPYPRKLVITPVSVGMLDLEKPTRSVSPNLSLSGKENQSPTSVLFALDSEGQASADSSPNASPSCVTSATGGGILFSKRCNVLVEENGSSSPLQVNTDDPTPIEPPPGVYN